MVSWNPVHANTPILFYFSLPSPPPAVSISSLIPPILRTSPLLAGIKRPFAQLWLRRISVSFCSLCVSSFHFFHLYYAKLRKRLASVPGLSRYQCPFPKDPGVFPATGSGFCQGVLSVVSRKKKNPPSDTFSGFTRIQNNRPNYSQPQFFPPFSHRIL